MVCFLGESFHHIKIYKEDLRMKNVPNIKRRTTTRETEFFDTDFMMLFRVRNVDDFSTV